MRTMTYDERDELMDDLRHRTDLIRYVPQGGAMMTEAAAEFWSDVLARLRRGEWADAVTEIERRFEPRMNMPDARQRATLINSRGKRKMMVAA